MTEKRHLCDTFAALYGTKNAATSTKQATKQGLSDNSHVVGYQTIARPANQNSCGGSMFMNVGSNVYTLNDIKITTIGASADRNNYIVFWAAGSTIKVDKNRAYWWDSVNNAWRIRNGATKSKDGTVADPSAILINPGEGFLCNFAQAETTITYAGEVLKGVEKKLVITRPEGIQNFSACNVSGAEISLSDISITTIGASADRNNYIVFMAAGSTIKVDKNRAYWWDSVNNAWRIRNGATKSKDGTVADPSAIKIAAGEGFLCNFAQAETTLTLPTAL